MTRDMFLVEQGRDASCDTPKSVRSARVLGCGRRGNLKAATEYSVPACKLSCYQDIVLSR